MNFEGMFGRAEECYPENMKPRYAILPENLFITLCLSAVFGCIAAYVTVSFVECRTNANPAESPVALSRQATIALPEADPRP